MTMRAAGDKPRPEKPHVRMPLQVVYRPREREFRASFNDMVLYLRACPRLEACGVWYRNGPLAVFEANDVPRWNFNDEQQRFVDAVRIATQGDSLCA